MFSYRIQKKSVIKSLFLNFITKALEIKILDIKLKALNYFRANIYNIFFSYLDNIMSKKKTKHLNRKNYIKIKKNKHKKKRKKKMK